MDETDFREQVVTRLNVIAQLLLVRPQEESPPSFTKMAQRLSGMGLGPADIGALLGKPTNHITSALNKLQKSKTKGRK